MPIPPQSAIAIAISDSVTVSIGEDTSGVFRVIFLVSADVNSTSSAAKSMKPGNMMKSLAKMKGFSPWPGLVSNPTKDIKKPTSKKPNIHCIFFFGSNNYVSSVYETTFPRHRKNSVEMRPTTDCLTIIQIRNKREIEQVCTTCFNFQSPAIGGILSAWIEENNIKPYLEYKEQLMKSNKSANFKEACEAIEKFIKDKSDNPGEGPDAAFDRLRASLELDKPANDADGAYFDGDDSVGGSTSTPKPKAKKDKGFGDAPIKCDRVQPRYKKPVSEAMMALQRELDLAVQEFLIGAPPTAPGSSTPRWVLPVQYHIPSGGKILYPNGSTTTQKDLLGQPVKKKSRKKVSRVFPINAIKKRAGLLAKKLIQGSKHRLKHKLSQEMMDLQEALDHTVLSFANNDMFFNAGEDVAKKVPFVSMQRYSPENLTDKVQPGTSCKETFASKTAVSPKSSPSKTNKTLKPEASPMSPSLPEAADLEQLPVAAHIEVPYAKTDIKVPSIALHRVPTANASTVPYNTATTVSNDTASTVPYITATTVSNASSTNDTASTVPYNTATTVVDIKLPRVPNIVTTAISTSAASTTAPNNTASTMMDIKSPSVVLHRVPNTFETAVPKNNIPIIAKDTTSTVPDTRLPSIVLHKPSTNSSTVPKATSSIRISAQVPATEATNSVPKVQIEPTSSKTSSDIPNNACSDVGGTKCTDAPKPKEYRCVVMSCSTVEEKKPSAIPLKPTRVSISLSPSTTNKSESVPKKKRRTSGNAETSTPTPKRSRKVSMDTSEDYDMDTSLMNHSQKKANASSSLLDRPSNVIRPLKRVLICAQSDD
ncbi:hypothetical protein B566_EDAN011438 [Ephemera danica]|nr:hypothetical protein B566_EDAN011438 [Ephemera danica]